LQNAYKFEEQSMTDKTFAKIGTTIFQVIKDGQPSNELVDSFDTALRRIAIAFTSVKEYETYGRLDEFEGLDTVELGGTYRQRLRFAIEETGRQCAVAEHRLTGVHEPSSVVRTIEVTTEFDPGYELQAGLYYTAGGDIEPENAAKKLTSIINDKIVFERISKSDEDIVAAIIEVNERMGGESFGAAEARDATAFLNQLPIAVSDRYEALAAKAFPAPAFSI
jgi:hypothetical protein